MDIKAYSTGVMMLVILLVVSLSLVAKTAQNMIILSAVYVVAILIITVFYFKRKR